MNKKLRRSKFAIFALCAIFIVILALLSNFLWQENKRLTEEAINLRFVKLQQEFQQKMNDVILDARRIAIQESKSVLIHDALKGGKAKQYLTSHWSVLFDVYPTLQQIRYISVDGDEKLRADKQNGQLIWRNTEDMQNKANRYYFIETIESDQEYYVSPLDLNKERGRVEYPYRPTIRSVAKYRVNGEVEALLVLNFDLSEVFSNLNALQNQGAHWLINSDGFFLSSPNDASWGWLLDHPENQVSMYFPGFVSQLNGDKNSQPDPQFTHNFKYGKISIGNALHDDTKFAESYYWLVMKYPKGLLSYSQRIQLGIFTGFVVASFILMAFCYLLIRLLKQIHLEKEQAVEAKEKATSAEKAKADFLARMSHEIRTPMNGVYGLLQITQGERNYKKINNNIEQAISSFSLLSRVIDDVLDFSKIEAGKLDIIDAPFRLDNLLNQVGQMMGRAAYGKHLELWIDVDPQCPQFVEGDEVRLNQIITNLISNAIKFTSRGEVNLRVSVIDEDTDMVCLGFEVQDTGIGMTEEQADQVFRAFTQASRDTNSKYGGTGLGLSIAKQLVEMMNGKIGVVSKPEVGSTFYFNVRLKKSNNDKGSQPIEREIKSYQAIILTKNVNAESIIQRQCSVLGWPSYVVKNTDELVSRQPSTHLPKVLLIDEGILDFIDKDALRDWQNTQSDITHLVIVSHNRNHQNENLSIKYDDFLLKPFTPSSLYDAVVSCEHQWETTSLDTAHEVSEDKLLAKTLILVVEDNPINQQVAGAMLKGAGAIVKFAENGVECLSLLNEGLTPHIILMDMQMPLMGGIEAAENIRKNNKWDGIPIIAMTANAMDSDKKRCIDAGMQAHIVKPVVKQHLLNVVASQLSL